MNRDDAVWKSEGEFLEFVRALDRLCAPCEYVVTSSNGELKFHFCAIATEIGIIDVFRYQRKAAWGSDEMPSVQVGQDMFRYDESTAQVNDLCDSGYKYVLPNSSPSLYTVESAPTLQSVVIALHKGRNVSNRFKWQGPYSIAA